MAPRPRRWLAFRNVLRRLDAAARVLNPLLVVIAIGLALLDFHFAVSQRILERIPITRVVCDDGAVPGTTGPERTPAMR